MLIPWNTDAPLYHPPWATGGLIALNTAVFAAVVLGVHDPEAIAPWILTYGQGLHPLQWITANFLHAGLMHLVGNMIFLWAFGLVIEGKLGWLRFTAVYLGLGVVQSAFEQVCTLGFDQGGSFGASAIIYGLLAMALVWAPRNEMSCLLLVGFRVFTFEISILVLAVLYLSIEMITTIIDGFGWSSAVLHLSGAALGFVVGIWLVKSGSVDCEGWDLFAVLAGDEGRKTKKKKRRKPKAAADAQRESQQLEARRTAALDEVRRLLVAGQARGAHALAKKMSQTLDGFGLAEDDSLKLIAALNKEHAWNESVEQMVAHLAQFPEKSSRVRLKLGQLLVRELNRPAQGLRVLSKLESGDLPASLDSLRRQLMAEATQRQEQGAVELAGEDW
ncbi:MAG TPA: rhomboid family intramembrane serine protease [Pirellulales bacterium]|nr:rhomboid family intramembrane serine protease [Pirellulales bacterium]